MRACDMKTAFLAATLLCGCSWSSGSVGPDDCDVWPAIQRELDAYGVCQFEPGVYQVSQTVVLRSGQQLIGSGIDQTRLRLMSDSRYYAELAIGSSFGLVRSHPNTTNCYVADLTLDANLGGQEVGNYTNTAHCVALNGGGHVVERVRAVGWGVGGQTVGYRESFPIIVQDGFSDLLPGGMPNRISGCEVTGPCFDYLGRGDASCIVLWSKHGPGVLENCRVYDIGMSDTPGRGWSRDGWVLGLTAYGNNVVCRNNTISNVAGPALWLGDSWENSGVVYSGNVCTNVALGIRLTGGSWDGLTIVSNIIHSTGPGMIIGGRPKIENLVVSDNTFDSGKIAQ